MAKVITNLTLDDIKEEVEFRPEKFIPTQYPEIEKMFYWHGTDVPKYLYLAWEEACKFGCEKQFIEQMTSTAQMTNRQRKERKDALKYLSYQEPVYLTSGYVIDGVITEVPMKGSFRSKYYCGYEFCDGKQFVYKIED